MERGSALAGGLERGYRLGLLGRQADNAEEDRAWQNEKRARERKDWDEEDLLKDFEANLVATPAPEPAPSLPVGVQPTAPMGADANGLAPTAAAAPVAAAKPESHLDRYSTTVSRAFQLLDDPKYAPVRGKALERITALSKQSAEMNQLMLEEARQRALPHMRTLYSPGVSDDQKSAALSTLMTELYPDGRQYRAQVSGDSITVMDEKGQPMMGADGKPMAMTMADVDTMVRDGLATPEAFFNVRQGAIEARATAAIKEEDYKRTRKDKLDDRDYTARQEQGKEARAEARALRQDRRNFISKAMAAFDRDAAAGLVDAKERTGYLEQVRATASETYGGSGPANPAPGAGSPKPNPAQPAGLGTPGTAIDVDLDTPAPTAAPAPAAGLPPVPVPKGAAAPAATPEIGMPADLTIEPTAVAKAGKSIAGAAAGAVAGLGDAGRAIQAKIPTNFENTARTVKTLRVALGTGKPLTRDTVGQVRELARQPDDALVAAGLKPREIQTIRAIAQKLGAR